jgi:5'-nucleotidase
MPLINVNFPREPRGVIWTRVSVRHYDGVIVPTKDPFGRELYWFSVKPLEGADEGTDRWAVEQHWISMTPLRLDLTDEPLLTSCRAQWPLDETVAAATSPPKSTVEEAKSVEEDESPDPAPAR